MIFPMGAMAKALWDVYEKQKAQGLLTGAHQTLAKLEKVDPKDPRWLNAKGEVAFLEKSFIVAARFFKLAWATEKRPEYLLHLGNTLFSSEIYFEAKDVLTKYVSLNPNDTQAQVNLANSLIQLDEVEQAEALCKQRIQLGTDKSPFLNCLGYIATLRGNTQGALDFFSSAYDASPDNIDALFNRANSFYAINKTDEALKDYALCVRKDENYAPALQNMAIVYLEKGNTDEARKSLQKALKLLPESAEIYYTLGRVYMREKEFRLARDAFRTAVKIDNNHIGTLLALAKLCHIEMETTEAVHLVQRILTRAQLNAEERRAALTLAYELGQYELCLQSAQKLSESDLLPQQSLLLTTCLWKTGKKRDALLQIEKYLQKVGETSEALTLLGLMLEENGALDLAESRWRRAIELQPDSDAPAFELARLYRSTEQLDKAINVLETVLTKNSKDADCLFNLACCHARNKNLDDSLYYLKRAVENGFHDMDKLMQDEDLESLRALDAYGSVVEEAGLF